MWLPALSTYDHRNVLVQNYNEHSLGANFDSTRFCKTSSSLKYTYLNSSSCSSSTSSTLKQIDYKANCPTMSTSSSEIVQNSTHESEDLNQVIDKLESKSDYLKPADSSAAVKTVEIGSGSSSGQCTSAEEDSDESSQDKEEKKIGAVDKLDKPETKLNCKLEESNKDKQPDLKQELKSEKVDKLVDKLAELNRDVDANNNVCDKTACDDKLDPPRQVNKDAKSKGEIMSSTTVNSSTGAYKPHQCSVATSYHVYSNGCVNNKRTPNKSSPSTQQLNDTSSNNNKNAQTPYTQHALNHSAHLSATPYTIYTTGHYGQPTTILSIPQNATIGHLHQSAANSIVNQSTLVNQASIGQQASINQAHHLHHYHSNQTHNNHPSATSHLHYHATTANIPQQQQNYHHSNYNNHQSSLSQQNNQKNLMKNSNSIKSSLSSSSASSSLNSSTTVSNNASSAIHNSSNQPPPPPQQQQQQQQNSMNCNTKPSSSINSTYTSTYTNSNSPSSPTATSNPTSASSTNSAAGQQHLQINHQQLQSKNLNLVEQTPHYYHSGYYNGILNGKDTTYTFRKIFVGGLPYHSTDKTLSKFFQAFGEIEEAVVITDRQSGRSKGYGFVTMCDQESAERAVKDANPYIDGRKANVNLAYLGAKPRTTSIPPNTGTNLYSLRNPATGYSPSVISTNSQYSLAPTAYMYSNGLLLSQAPTMITGYPANATCAYFDYASSFADPTHLTATISPLNGAYATAQTSGPPLNHHSQGANNNGQYGSPPDGQPTLFAPIPADLAGQVYGFAPIQHRF